MKKKKANYYPPTVEVKIVQLEQGVAASSATITPGGPTGSNLNPEIEDWTTETSSKDLFF